MALTGKPVATSAACWQAVRLYGLEMLRLACLMDAPSGAAGTGLGTEGSRSFGFTSSFLPASALAVSACAPEAPEAPACAFAAAAAGGTA